MEPLSADRALADRIVAELASQSDIGKIPIEVIVDRGVVTLEGMVHSELVKERVEAVVRGAAGGATVNSEIAVKLHDSLRGMFPIVPPQTQ